MSVPDTIAVCILGYTISPEAQASKSADSICLAPQGGGWVQQSVNEEFLFFLSGAYFKMLTYVNSDESPSLPSGIDSLVSV